MSLEDAIEQSSRNEVSQFKDSIKRYLKKWPWILLGVVIALSIAVVKLKFAQEQYNVTSSIQVKKHQQADSPTDLLFGGRYSGRLSGIQDEIKILKSYPLVKETVASLNFDVVYQVDNGFTKKEIYGNVPFRLEYDRSDSAMTIPTGLQFKLTLLDEQSVRIQTENPYKGNTLDTTVQFGQEISFGSFHFRITKTADFSNTASYNSTYYIRLYSIDNIAYTYRTRLQFEEVESFSKILTMKMKTKVPGKTKDFMNTLIDKYIEQNLIDKNQAAKKTVEFIDSQLAIISDSLNRKEKNLEDFKSSSELSSLSVEGKLLMEKYNQIESEKAQHEVMQQYYEYLQKNLADESNTSLNNLIAPSAFGIEDQMVNELVGSLLELNITEKNLVEEGNTKSLLLKQVRSRKKEIMSALEESVQNLAKANLIILKNLDKRAEEVSQSAQKLPNTERKLVNLNRLLKLNENIYLFLMEKRSTAAISMSSNTPDCKVIEPAMLNPTSPIAPKKKMILLIAIALGIIIPFSIIVLVDFMNDTVKGKKDVELATSAPIMGLVPKVKLDGVRFVVLEKPKSILAESFRIIRTNLSFFQKGKSPFVIMVTSTVSQEGKTFCAINLASVLAASGKKTVLLGFDLRKPRIHTYLGEENSIGISNYLTNRADLEEIVKDTQQENLSVINSGSVPPNPAELIIGDKTVELIQELKKKFDYIIMDSPPLGIVTDALLLKEHSDLNLYVIRQGYSKREFLTRLNELYTSKDLPNLSILLNDTDKSSKYGSGYYVDHTSKSLGSRIKNFGKS